MHRSLQVDQLRLLSAFLTWAHASARDRCGKIWKQKRFHTSYYEGYILEKIKEKTLVLNNPNSIRNSPEKLLVTHFYDLMPPTLISRNKTEINNFLIEL